MSKHMDAELDALLATLSTILDSVGLPGAAEAETRAKAEEEAAFAQDAWLATRSKLVRKAEAVAGLIEGYDSLRTAAAAAASAQEHSTNMIRKQAEVRAGLLEARGLLEELARLHQVEARKKRSKKYSPEELKLRGEAVALLSEHVEGLQVRTV